MKKAIIVIELVDESEEVGSEQVKAEILENLEKRYAIIPWMKKVKKVTILEDCE